MGYESPRKKCKNTQWANTAGIIDGRPMDTTRGKTKVNDESLRKEVKEPNGSTW